MLPYYNKSPPIHLVKQVLVNVATEKFFAEIEAEASICMPQYYMEEWFKTSTLLFSHFVILQKDLLSSNKWTRI